ncbi:MAG TPA: serine/threonine-protein kinase [Streptosporangiaceae bacterium]|nr:serine/threonine-protein kinase [Streptosporangiaceae bacterium]
MTPGAVPARLVPGGTVGGYRLEQRLGQGGMAVVYLARHDRTSGLVALKVLTPALGRSAEFRARFVRESQAAVSVSHRHILPVHDAGEADGHLYIAMRYVRGGDVRGLLRRAGPLPPGLAGTVIAQIASGLDIAHASGLVHRDVKPANMLLEAPVEAAGAGRYPIHGYLADFGVSKQVLAPGLTVTGQIVGTLDYIAPEQLEGRPLDGRADQYSLACTAYELLAGIPPFRRGQREAIIYAQMTEPPPSLAARRPGIAATVDAVLAKALSKSRSGRYRSCTEFAADLSLALGQAAAAPRATDETRPARRPPRGTEPPTARRDP